MDNTKTFDREATYEVCEVVLGTQGGSGTLARAANCPDAREGKIARECFGKSAKSNLGGIEENDRGALGLCQSGTAQNGHGFEHMDMEISDHPPSKRPGCGCEGDLEVSVRTTSQSGGHPCEVAVEWYYLRSKGNLERPA